jgi:hypothetical protein
MVDPHCRQGIKHIGMHFLLVTASTGNFKMMLSCKSFLFDNHHAILVPDLMSCSRALAFRCIAYIYFHHICQFQCHHGLFQCPRRCLSLQRCATLQDSHTLGLQRLLDCFTSSVLTYLTSLHTFSVNRCSVARFFCLLTFSVPHSWLTATSTR